MTLLKVSYDSKSAYLFTYNQRCQSNPIEKILVFPISAFFIDWIAIEEFSSVFHYLQYQNLKCSIARQLNPIIYV